MARKFRKIPLRNKLALNLGHRETIYKYIGNQNSGVVPCYVCGKHVKWGNATLEHIIPLSMGGEDKLDNLSISHYQCNMARGNNIDFSWNKKK